MKYKIEKNTVQETLILPLYSRKLCTELYPNLYRDETAVRLFDQIDYDFSEAEKNSRSLMQRFGALEVAMRQNDLAFEAVSYTHLDVYKRQVQSKHMPANRCNGCYWWYCISSHHEEMSLLRLLACWL